MHRTSYYSEKCEFPSHTQALCILARAVEFDGALLICNSLRLLSFLITFNDDIASEPRCDKTFYIFFFIHIHSGYDINIFLFSPFNLFPFFSRSQCWLLMRYPTRDIRVRVCKILHSLHLFQLLGGAEAAALAANVIVINYVLMVTSDLLTTWKRKNSTHGICRCSCMSDFDFHKQQLLFFEFFCWWLRRCLAKIDDVLHAVNWNL